MMTSSFRTGLSDYHIYQSQNKFENFEPKKLIKHNFRQYDTDQFKLDIFNSMSAMRSHAAFENNFASILDKHAPKKTKIFTRESKTPF